MTVNLAIAQINSTVGDLSGNSEKIADYARRAAEQGADIVVTPELSLVGYPPEDLLLRRSFYAKSDEALAALAAYFLLSKQGPLVQWLVWWPSPQLAVSWALWVPS